MASLSDGTWRPLPVLVAEKTAAFNARIADFDAVATAATAARFATIKDVAAKIYAEQDPEKAIPMAWALDGGWVSDVAEVVLPGGQYAADKLQQADNYRPSVLLSIGDAVQTYNAAHAAAQRAVSAKFNGPVPWIMAGLIDKKFGAGSFNAWVRAVQSPTWWDSTGIPIIQAVLLAYVGGSFFSDGGASAAAADGATTTEAGAVVVESSATEGIVIAGVETGFSTGYVAIDAAIAGFATEQVGNLVNGGAASPPAQNAPAVTQRAEPVVSSASGFGVISVLGLLAGALIF